MMRLGLVFWVPLVAFVSTAEAVQSTFDLNLEGWTADGTSAFVATGGNPGGFLQVVDAASSVMHVYAPATFQGDLSHLDGTVLTFDGRRVAGGGSALPGSDDYGVVRITGGGLAASADVLPGGEAPPLGVWQTYFLPFDAASFAVSQHTWDTILADVTELRITIEAFAGSEVQAIDNVYLGACNGGASTTTTSSSTTLTTATTTSSTTSSSSSSTSSSSTTHSTAATATTSSSTTSSASSTSSSSVTTTSSSSSSTHSTAITSPSTSVVSSSATSTSTSSTSSTLPTACERLGGKRLLLKSRAGTEKRGLRLLSLDDELTLGGGNGSADDPVLHGGTLRVSAEAGDRFDDVYHFGPDRWRYRKREGRNRGYRLLLTAPFREIVLQPGRRVEILANGTGLGHTLQADPGAVSVVLTIGAHCYCWRFGGELAFTPDRKVQAKNAPAPSDCASQGPSHSAAQVPSS